MGDGGLRGGNSGIRRNGEKQRRTVARGEATAECFVKVARRKTSLTGQLASLFDLSELRDPHIFSWRRVHRWRRNFCTGDGARLRILVFMPCFRLHWKNIRWRILPCSFARNFRAVRENYIISYIFILGRGIVSFVTLDL